MGRVTVDFSEVEEFEAFAKGEYQAVIEKGTWVEQAQDDKYPYINVELTVTDGEYKDRKTWVIWSFSPKALFRMKQDMENLGIISEDEALDIDVDEETELVISPEIAGMPCILVCDKPRMYEGREQTNGVALLSADGAGPKKTTPAKKTTAKPAAGAKKQTTRKFK